MSDSEVNEGRADCGGTHECHCVNATVLDMTVLVNELREDLDCLMSIWE